MKGCIHTYYTAFRSEVPLMPQI